jgi:hypothetical protein
MGPCSSRTARPRTPVSHTQPMPVFSAPGHTSHLPVSSAPGHTRHSPISSADAAHTPSTLTPGSTDTHATRMHHHTPMTSVPGHTRHPTAFSVTAAHAPLLTSLFPRVQATRSRVAGPRTQLSARPAAPRSDAATPGGGGGTRPDELKALQSCSTAPGSVQSITTTVNEVYLLNDMQQPFNPPCMGESQIGSPMGPPRNCITPLEGLPLGPPARKRWFRKKSNKAPARVDWNVR